MKPVNYRSKYSSNKLNIISNNEDGIGNIQGQVQELGISSSRVTVALYNKANLSPITVSRTNELGEYQFLGLNTSLNCCVVAFDITKKYNAVIQDNIVPK